MLSVPSTQQASHSYPANVAEELMLISATQEFHSKLIHFLTSFTVLTILFHFILGGAVFKIGFPV